ncbi:MAG: hypothetical protein ACTSP1_11810, partial [Candidatus Freyarchaeota archaeon]
FRKAVVGGFGFWVLFLLIGQEKIIHPHLFFTASLPLRICSLKSFRFLSLSSYYSQRDVIVRRDFGHVFGTCTGL